MIKLRASRVELARLCPMSMRPGGVQSTSEPARMGTAVHAALAEYVMNRPFEFAHVAGQNGVSDLEELRILFNCGVSILKQLREDYGLFNDCWVEAYSQCSIEQVLALSGHADVMEVAREDAKTIHLLDWKTGRERKTSYDQLATYAYLILHDERLASAGIEEVVPITAWIRDREIEIGAAFTRENLDEWLKAMLADLNRDVFCPGHHCTFCPYNHTCEALNNKNKSALAIFRDLNPAEMTPAELAPIIAARWDELRHLEAKIKEVKDLVKEQVKERGSLPTSIGHKLVMETRQRKRWNDDELDEMLIKDGWTILDCDSCRSYDSKAVLESIKARAKQDKEKIGDAVKLFLEEAEECGALSYKETQALTEIKDV